MLLNILVASYLVHADVIRDDGYNNYEGQFSVVHKGRMLRVLMYFDHIKLEECALHCVRHLRCKTINYHPIKKACELTDEEFDEMDADTISIGWYNHGTPPRVDGGWSNWRNLTECTKKCESGTLEQWRDCDSPKPDHGGVYCKGRMRRRVNCNTHECPVINIALGKTARQSSIYTNIDQYAPSKAVDGKADTRILTDYKYGQWWLVNLGKVIVIRHIRLNAVSSAVHPRNNRGLRVETRKGSKEDWILCYDIGDTKETVIKFTCNAESARAQYLRILSTKECHLNIFEVETYVNKNN